MTDPVAKIADAVLYEGYVLWPYRRSARKNQQRWTLGGVYPRAFCEAGGGHDPWQMQAQCLVVGDDPTVQAQVRFLHVVERRVGRMTAAGALEFVDELQVGRERYLAWDEATEREIRIADLRLPELADPAQVAISIPAGSEQEPLRDEGGEIAGALVRSWQSLEGAVEVAAEPVREQLCRLTVRITNTTPWKGQARERTLKQTLVAAHAILRVRGGEFVSLMDPPADLQAVAEACQNMRTWPVLAGVEGDRRTVLCSPIILYDYPQIAPESPGDLFDGTEIDQLLILNILTLTDAEKEEMRASDPRAREILERCESMTPQEFMTLHGAIREFRMLSPEAKTANLFATLERPVPQSVSVEGVEVRKGSRVRLRPRPGGDIMDLALAGKVAIIEAIDQDYEDRIHLSVTMEDDPGRDLGDARVLGHRFFFSPEEVEPLKEA